MDWQHLLGSGSATLAFLTSIAVFWRTVHLGEAVQKNTEITQKVEILVNSRMSTALAKIAALELALAELRKSAQ